MDDNQMKELTKAISDAVSKAMDKHLSQWSLKTLDFCNASNETTDYYINREMQDKLNTLQLIGLRQINDSIKDELDYSLMSNEEPLNLDNKSRIKALFSEAFYTLQKMGILDKEDLEPKGLNKVILEECYSSRMENSKNYLTNIGDKNEQ